jgi:hypothetical protein
MPVQLLVVLEYAVDGLAKVLVETVKLSPEQVEERTIDLQLRLVVPADCVEGEPKVVLEEADLVDYPEDVYQQNLAAFLVDFS